MAKKERPKGAPPVTSKSLSNERVERGMRANTGGDPYDRSQNRYSKGQPDRLEEAEDGIPFFDEYSTTR